MEYSNLSIELISHVPELRSNYEQELELWDGKDPGAHNIFGDVLNPFLLKLLDENNNKQLLSRIFAFLEKMAISQNKLVQEVLACTVLERIGDDKIILEKAEQFMGEATKKICIEINKGWGRL